MLKCIRVLLLATACMATRSNYFPNNGVNTPEYSVQGHNKEVVCYWGTWANYRPSVGRFTPKDIDPSLCTNLIYSFAGLNSTTWNIRSLDTKFDMENEFPGYKMATDLKLAYPHLKVTVAIGGWNEGSEKFSALAKDPNKRKVFVQSVVEFLQQHNFDGLDLDWEYPNKRGGIAEDKANFVSLIRDLKESFEPHNFLLTAAIAPTAATIDLAYDIPAMYEHLDFVHVMSYDYHGKWDNKTGHNAPLFARPDESGKDLFNNVAHTVHYLMEMGAVPEKTILGVPFYGRAFLLEDPASNEMGALTKNTSFAGRYTREDGFLGYNEICEEQLEQDQPWTTEWDEHYKAPYMHKGARWISYDNEESIRIKTHFALDKNLGGVMTWSIDIDDFSGVCGGPRYPLLRTINNAIYERQHGSGGQRVVSGKGVVLLAGFVIALQRMVL